MTAIRQEAIHMLENVPEDKLEYVIQIMRGINGILGVPEIRREESAGLGQFVMTATERGQKADDYVREMRDNDRL